MLLFAPLGVLLGGVAALFLRGMFYENYPDGTGLMSGSVFGKLAGESAASYVKIFSLNIGRR